MLSRILLGSFLATTSLAVIPSAKAGFDEYGNLRISVKRLQKGYEEGTLTLKDGTRFSVAKANEWFMPCFSMIYNQNIKIYGYGGKDEYTFNHMEGGGPRYFQNPQTLEWECDDTQISPGIECLGLVLKKIATQPLNEIVLETTSSSLPVAPPVEILLNLEEKTRDVLSKEEGPSSLPKKVPGKIFKESDTPKNTAQKDFYLQYDEKRNVWIGIEYLTPKAATWWAQRLGWDAHMHFGKQIEREQLFVFQMPEETKVSMQKSSMEFAESMSMIFGGSSSNSTDLIPRYVREAEAFCSLRSSGFESGKEFMELYDEKAPQDYNSHNDNYLSAWRGFQYNLKHAHKRPTWIAYISSKPTEGPLYETVSVTSPDIKMMMTATPGDKFYSPLGIYKSPIATAYDEKVGQKYDQLSMPLHGATARFMRQIQPEMQYMVVRPLASMGSIFGKTKVPSSSSNGRRQETQLPYIRCTTPFQHRWYDEPEKLTSEEMDNFGKSPYILIDSRTNEYHQMSDQHWFSESPFLGGQTRDFFETFPFVTIDVEDLGKL